MCRLCRKQALIAGPDNNFAVDHLPVATVTGQQLLFADLPVSERTRRATAAAATGPA